MIHPTVESEKKDATIGAGGEKLRNAGQTFIVTGPDFERCSYENSKVSSWHGMCCRPRS